MNKKIVAILLMGLLSIALLSGCSESSEKTKDSEEADQNKRFDVHRIDKRTFVLVDKESKVQYLKVWDAGPDGYVAVVPLYQTNGKPYINKEVKDNRFSIKKEDDYTLIITDNETNVEYLNVFGYAGDYDYYGSVTLIPLLNPSENLLANDNE